MWSWLVLACAPAPSPAPAPAAAVPAPAPSAPAEGAAEAEARALAAAREAVPALAGALAGRLGEVLGREGPEAAAAVCAGEAQATTRRLAAERGVAAGRSSLRLRNPANAAPDWVAAWLAAQGERPAAGVTGFERVDVVGDRRFARVLRPIPVGAPCVTCHGPAEGLPAGVRALLAERYPTDAAVGYAEGDLRGAVWAEAEVR